MQFSLRHVVLVIGSLCIILSFLFFGHKHHLYERMLLIGLVLSALSFVAVLIKETWKAKLSWIGIVLIFISIQRLSESFFISKSFQFLIDKHEKLFNEVNNIMASKADGIIYWGIGHQNSRRDFSDREIQLLE